MSLPDRILVVYTKADFFIFFDPIELEKVDAAVDKLADGKGDTRLELRSCAGPEYSIRASRIEMHFLTTADQRRELAAQDKEWNGVFREKPGKDWERDDGEED